MAHIVVYLQRTPQGLHPASAVATCWARDIASERGATVTAFCPGDAGVVDRGIATAAGRFGADIVVFGGPGGLHRLCERLQPTHVLVPYSDEGIEATANLPGGPLVPRWIDSESPPLQGADAITGVVAGTLPWHRSSLTLEAEYEGDVDHVDLPAWVEAVDPDAASPSFLVTAPGDVGFVSEHELDRVVEQRLAQLGGSAVDDDTIAAAQDGTYLRLQRGSDSLPQIVATRGPGSRLIVLVGPDAVFDPSWANADLVFGGAWPEVLDDLLGGPWETAHG